LAYSVVDVHLMTVFFDGKYFFGTLLKFLPT